MGSSYFGDYRSMPTAELENLWRHSVRPDEKHAMQQELTRRYLYADSSGEPRRAPGANSTVPPEPMPGAQYAPGPTRDYNQPSPPQADYWAKPSRKTAPQPKRRSDGHKRRKRSKLAIASFVLSILWIGWLGSIAGLILGCIALKRVKKRDQRGRWFAIAGIAIGIVGLLVYVAIIGRDSR